MNNYIEILWHINTAKHSIVAALFGMELKITFRR